MSNRLTQMDGELPLILPGKVARDRAIRRVTQARPNGDAFWSKSTSPSQSKVNIVEAKHKNYTQLIHSKTQRSYHEFMALDQAGPAVIARENVEDGSFVAIKRVKRVDPKPAYHIPDSKSDHLVNIKEIFLEDNDIVIVYEQMDVSLRHIMAVNGGPLQAFEIAAICKKLVDGLSYIHEKLSLFHGTLGCNTVLLNQDGKIKIANIAESILERKVFSIERGINDIKHIGIIMVELMEPTTSILDPNSTILENPEKWRDELGIKDFLAATQRDSLAQLKMHLFLPPEHHGSWLERHVFDAVRAAKIPWDKPSLA